MLRSRKADEDEEARDQAEQDDGTTVELLGVHASERRLPNLRDLFINSHDKVANVTAEPTSGGIQVGPPLPATKRGSGSGSEEDKGVATDDDEANRWEKTLKFSVVRALPGNTVTGKRSPWHTVSLFEEKRKTRWSWVMHRMARCMRTNQLAIMLMVMSFVLGASFYFYDPNFLIVRAKAWMAFAMPGTESAVSDNLYLRSRAGLVTLVYLGCGIIEFAFMSSIEYIPHRPPWLVYIAFNASSNWLRVILLFASLDWFLISWWEG